MLSWLWKPIALASTLAFSTLGVLSRRYERARLYFHLGIYISVLGAASVWGVLISIMATVAGQRLNINYYVARSFYHVCSPLTGIKIDVEGEEHLTGLLNARGGKGQSAVLVGNHQSFLDILYLGRIFPRRAAIMAKQELKWSPLLGQYLALSGAVFVDRKNRQAAMEALEQAGDDMKKKGVSLWVFPEGTRSSSADPKLLPFKKGAFHLAVQAQVPIVPVICENYHRLFDGRTRMEQGQLKIRVLPPISTEGLGPDDVHALTDSTRESMLDALRDISVPGPSSGPASSSSIIDEKQTAFSAPVAHPSDATTPSSASQDAVKDVGLRQRRTEGLDDSGKLSSKGRSSEEGRGGESTEDEMDDDAVLLRRPEDV